MVLLDNLADLDRLACRVRKVTLVIRALKDLMGNLVLQVGLVFDL